MVNRIRCVFTSRKGPLAEFIPLCRHKDNAFRRAVIPSEFRRTSGHYRGSGTRSRRLLSGSTTAATLSFGSIATAFGPSTVVDV